MICLYLYIGHNPSLFNYRSDDKMHNDIFEDAVAQELKIQLRKQIEAELKEDYQLKLKQQEIEYQMKLHKETKGVRDQQRREKEDYEKKIDDLSAKLTEYSKNGKINLMDEMPFDADEMVYLSGGDGMTNFSSPMSEYDVDSDDEKEAFDQGIMDTDYVMNAMMPYGQRHRDSTDLNENEDEKPLIEKKKFDDNEYAEQVLDHRDKKKQKQKKKKKKKKRDKKQPLGETQGNNRSDDKCFSCFGLFTGTGV